LSERGFHIESSVFATFYQTKMSDCESRPSKMQRIDGEASKEPQDSQVAVDKSSAVAKPPRSENQALQGTQPFASRASDFLSNVSNFKIIESTLRGTYI